MRAKLAFLLGHLKDRKILGKKVGANAINFHELLVDGAGDSEFAICLLLVDQLLDAGFAVSVAAHGEQPGHVGGAVG